MYNLAIGVDIEDIERFKDKSREFLDRIYTKDEQEYCLAKAKPESHLAVRFCAKEAAIKALSALNIKVSEYNNIEVFHEENQCPSIRLLKKIDKKLTFEVSLSHDKTKAIAFVTVHE